MKILDFESKKGKTEITKSFNVQLLNPCDDTILKPSFENLSLYAILDYDIREYEYLDFTDHTSELNDDQNDILHGTLLCETRIYKLYQILENLDRVPLGKDTNFNFIDIKERT